MRAVLYCRVSTTEQAKNLSLPTQEKACREYCARHGYEIDRVFVDSESAKTSDRTEFRRLLEHCRHGRGRLHALVVYSVNRFARNNGDHHAVATLLRGLGITLRSVTEPIDDSPTGRLMEGMLATIAQFDNDVRAERVTAGMKAAIDRGRWVWPPPLGYLSGGRNGPSLLPDPDRAAVVREAFTLCAAGVRGRPLLHRLRALGLRTRRGNAISLNRLYELLRHRAYIGYVRSAQWHVEIRGDFEPLVDEEIFGRVQAQLAQHARGGRAQTRHINHPDFPLRRFARCQVCGQAMTGSTSTGRSQRYGFYHCKAGCTRVSTTVLEQRFLALLDDLRPREAYWRLLKASILDAWKELRKTHGTARAAAQRQISGLTQQLEQLERAFIFDQRIDQASYARQRDRLREDVAIAKMALADATAQEDDIEGDLAFAEHALYHASALWTAAATVEDRIKIQWAMFPQGLIVRTGSTPRSGTSVVEPQITAVSCLEFFELAERPNADVGMVDHLYQSSNRGLAWMGHMLTAFGRAA